MRLREKKSSRAWRREKKLRLVLKSNPRCADLSAEWKEDESWQPFLKPKFGLCCGDGAANLKSSARTLAHRDRISSFQPKRNLR